ncbi:hypothetical protein C8R43DRAFT_943646 [Mycena crocata]|nr:hypothetical protein C8R43DRAFT_943646 [Mycena crocata]
MLLVRGYKPESAVPVVIICCGMAKGGEKEQQKPGESCPDHGLIMLAAYKAKNILLTKVEGKQKAVDDGHTLKKQKTKSGKEEEDDEQEEKVLETENYMNVELLPHPCEVWDESTVLISWDPQPGAGNIPLSFWEKASNQWDETLV